MNKPPKNYQEWQTPRALFDGLNAARDYQIDLFASDKNALLPRYFTKERSAYDNDWDCSKSFNVFGNPPYDEERKAFECAMEKTKNKFIFVDLLLKCDTSTKLFHEIYKYAQIFLFTSRIEFGLPAEFDAPRNRPHFTSMLVRVCAAYDRQTRNGVVGRICAKTGAFL